MAGIVRLNELPEGSGSLSNDDIFVFMDDPSGGGVTKKISLSQIGTAILANDSRWDYFLPSAPSGVSGVEGDRSVSLTWTSSGEPVETLPVTDYVIQYSSDNGTTWTTFADVVSPSTSVVVDNLVNNTNYKFRVRAVNGIGLGAYSSMSSTLTPEMPKPSGVTGSSADEAVFLTWSAPSPSPIDGITDYLIQYSSNNGSTWTTFDDGISIATSGTVTGLTNGTGYKFRVAAVNNVETSNYSSSSDTVTPNVPNPAYLLMHFDGNLNDSSANQFSVTAVGEATVSTTESKFGGSSLYLNGNGQYLNILGTDTGALENDDYTIEAWFRANSGSADGVFVTNWEGPQGGDFILGMTGGQLYGYSQQATTNNGEAAYMSGGTVVTGQWHHAALTRTGNTARLFLDGTMVASANVPYRGYISPRNPIRIGAYGTNGTFHNFSGYIDELRIITGTSLYSSDDGFVPPTAPF